jgi:hypothetical protein
MEVAAYEAAVAIEDSHSNRQATLVAQHMKHAFEIVSMYI